MPRVNRIEEAVSKIQREIEDAVELLDDEEYVAVMDEIASYCESSAEAKREEWHNEAE